MMHAVDSNATSATLWNGPVCMTCGARFLKAHECSPSDLLRRIRELEDMLDAAVHRERPPRFKPVTDTSSCPCRPENGGSGVCGCVLSGLKVTC